MTPGQQARGVWFYSMELKLYDTLTREKRVFTPLDPTNVRMYVCGPTVYDFAHIGNARPVIVFDVLFRLLRHLYGTEHVTYVRNITDVEAIRKVTEKTDRQFHEDVAALGCLPPTVEPRATEHIAEMRALIEQLVASGNAYVAADHVLFSVASMPDYGKLSKRPLDEMIAGARVEVAPYKRDPMDFVLWKPSKPGEPAWPSPCGITAPGRPGWHIECSAMADKWLWTEALPRLSASGRAHPHQFDIHGGGIDLVFPHHENEIAQSRSAFHTPAMANFWTHNGYLQVEGEKMSKSLGNFVTIRDLLETEKFGARSWPGSVLRLAMLMTHYREPLDWTVARLDEAAEVLDSCVEATERIQNRAQFRTPHPLVLEVLADDLNTPRLIKVLTEIARKSRIAERDAHLLAGSINFLGLRLANRPTKRGRLDEALKWTWGRIVDGEAPHVALAEALDRFRLQGTGGHLYLLRRLWTRVALLRAAAREIAEIEKHGSGLEALYNQIRVTRNAAVHGSLGRSLSGSRTLSTQELKELIAARDAARARKDWAESDRIRDELAKMGVVLKDTKDGTAWEIAR
jgi:cysteinyl-tRNA synthetase